MPDINLIAAIAVAVVLAVVGFFLGSFYRKKADRNIIGSADDQAKKILSDAMNAAEAKKKEALIEAKDEIHRLRTESENELKERRREVQRQENRFQ